MLMTEAEVYAQCGKCGVCAYCKAVRASIYEIRERFREKIAFTEHLKSLLEALDDGKIDTAKEWLRAAIKLLERPS